MCAFSIRSVSKQQGFSLLEILVAFAILSLSLGVIFQIYSTGLRSSVRSGLHSKAAIIAAAQLARLGSDIKLEATSESGDAADDFSWSMEIYPYEFEEDVPGVEAFKVDLSVRKKGMEKFLYQVSTLRIADN